MGFEHTGGETAWRGRLLSVRIERFRHDDGGEAVREIVHHDGAAALLELARHELGEEVGKGARQWRKLTSFRAP